jgi:hypothetical protein
LSLQQIRLAIGLALKLRLLAVEFTMLPQVIILLLVSATMETQILPR